MSTHLRNSAFVAVIMHVSLAAMPLRAQLAETLPISMTDEYFDAGRGSALLANPPRVDMTNTAVFDRGKRNIEFGLNWGSSGGSVDATSLFGLTIIDDYPRSMAAGLQHYGQTPVRIIAALNDEYDASPAFDKYGDLIAFFSNGIATQIDPEVVYDDDLHEPQPNATASPGAYHCFKHVDMSITAEHRVADHLKLKTDASAPSTLTAVLWGNTNSQVLYGARTNDASWGSWRSMLDQNGNRLYVTIRVRRSKAINTTLHDDHVVLRLQLSEGHSEADPIGTGGTSILFATVPSPGTTSSVLSYPNDEDAVWTVVRGKYWANMTVRNEGGESSDGVLPEAKRLGTVIGDDPPARQVFDITAGMLRALPGADDVSDWVEFSASVDFKGYRGTGEPAKNAPHDNAVTNNPFFGRDALPWQSSDQYPNPSPSGDPDVQYRQINDLSVAVFHSQTADVDIDWIRFETPHARRILRDEYRFEIARAVKKFHDYFTTTLQGFNGNHRILGIRIMEELGEEAWVVQRYMHRLLGGYAITEHPGLPNDRWRRIVAAPAFGDAQTPPTWHWNAGSTMIPREQTPAPYIPFGDGGAWVDPARARMCPNDGPSDSELSLRITESSRSIERSSLHLKYGIRGTVNEPSIVYESGVAKYRSSGAGNAVGTLERGDVDQSFGAWWNALSAYETQTGGQAAGIPSDAQTHATLTQMSASAYDAFLRGPGFAANYDMPMLMGIEKSRYDNLVDTRVNSYLFASEPWLEQIWAYNRYDAEHEAQDLGLGLSYVKNMASHHSYRPATAEEMRLSLGSAMIFGAKGYMFFVGAAGWQEVNETKTLFERGTWNHNCEQGATLGTGIGTATTADCTPATDVVARIWGDDPQPSHFGDDFAVAITTAIAPGHAAVLNGSAMIPRFLRKSDNAANETITRQGLLIRREQVSGATVYKQDYSNQLAGSCNSNVSAIGIAPDQLYVGMKSPRREILRHVERLNAPATDGLAHALATAPEDVRTWSEKLTKLSLRAWHGKGYQRLSATDPQAGTNHLAAVIDTGKVLTRWPQREVNAYPTGSDEPRGTPDYEPRDSAFYDLTLLSDDRATARDSFYVGIVNRRTNPVIVEDADDPQQRRYRFVTPVQMEDPAGGLADRPHAQVGAREITIPFRYQHQDGRRRLLHVTEVGYPTIAGTIDTIIAEDHRLALNFRPGEGRLFRVVPFVPTAETQAHGYLAFNSQTKLVAAPVYALTEGAPQPVATGLVRYHMVYFREDPPPAQGAAPQWNVYYRRSVPLDPQRVSDLTMATPWEPAEYRLNAGVRVRFAPNDNTVFGADRTRIYDNEIADMMLVPLNTQGADTAAATQRLDAAFPSISVAHDAAHILPVVRVSFACINTNGEFSSAIMIAENAFDDRPLQRTGGTDVVMPPVIGDARALLCGMARVGAPVQPYGIDDMARWGTPVISSTHERSYYAWSAEDHPVGVGSKPSVQGWFRAPGQLHAVVWEQPAQGVLSQASAYPTMPTYANMTAGEAATSLAWQDTWTDAQLPAPRTAIRYTRTWADINGNVVHGLPAVSMMPYLAPPPPLPPIAGGTIDIGQVNEAGIFPSMTRSVAEDPMTLVFRDGQGGHVERDYQFETVTWQSITPMNASVVRRRHIVHANAGAANEELFLWMNQSTTSSSHGLMHPGVHVARHRNDAFPLLYAPAGSLTAETGNRSDTATLTNWAALPAVAEAAYRAMTNITYRQQWSGVLHATTAAVDQLPLVYGVYNVPQSPFSPINTTKTYGMWSHVASRQDATTVPATYGMRRIQQVGLADPPSIAFDAASFYKPADADGEHALYRGVGTTNDETLLRIVDERGRALAQRFELESDREAATTTLRAVSETMAAVREREMEFEVVGGSLDAVDVAVDELDAGGRAVRSVAVDRQTMGLANGRAKGRLVLVNGQGRDYRVRVSSTTALVPCEMLELEPADASFDRLAPRHDVVVDLGSDDVWLAAGEMHMIPLPAADYVVIRTHAVAGAGLRVDVADLRGAVLRTASLQAGSAVVDVATLPAGVYAVTLRDAMGRHLQRRLLPVVR